MRNHIKPRNAAGHSGGVMLKLRSQYNLPTTAAATAATAATAVGSCWGGTWGVRQDEGRGTAADF